jgi:hypothetical protein
MVALFVVTLFFSSIFDVFCLQQSEQESIELAANLENIKEEKERLLNSLVEAE